MPRARDGSRAAWMLWGAPVATGVFAGALFLAVPEIDLGAARAFHVPDTGFVGRRVGWVEALRQAFAVLYFGTIALSLAGLALTWRGQRPWLGLGSRHWLFLAVCLAAGPGLVANLVFKSQWGRPRPTQIVEFGGRKAFTPPLVISRQCPRNCSFVSGEAASTYSVFYAGAALLPQWAVALIVVGTLGGLATGLVRMAQGAHFLSDVIFAGVFMALAVLALRWLILQRGGQHEREQRG